MGKKDMVEGLADFLLIVGGVNWALDVFGWNVVEMIPQPLIVKGVYLLVGAAAVYKAAKVLHVIK